MLKWDHRHCNCTVGYKYPHRPGSPFCQENPYSALYVAKRAGASDKELDELFLDLLWYAKGKVSKDCPF